MAEEMYLGVDIGGSGIEAAPVDVTTGTLKEERYEVRTPPGARPDDVTACVAAVLRHFSWDEPFGVHVPRRRPGRRGPHGRQRARRPDYPGRYAAKVIGDATNPGRDRAERRDAAGLAEMHYGAGQGASGTVVVLTLGTGIGSALFRQWATCNTELGHIELNGRDAETWAAPSVKTREGLDFPNWAVRLNRYLQTVETLLWPDLFILGGGISREADLFLPLLEVRCRVVSARLDNEAGIVGAAMTARLSSKSIDDGTRTCCPPKISETDVSSNTARIAGAMTGAADRISSLSNLRDSGTGTVFVITTRSIGAFLRRSTAGRRRCRGSP